jgi:hypothetical protein
LFSNSADRLYLHFNDAISVFFALTPTEELLSEFWDVTLANLGIEIGEVLTLQDQLDSLLI